VYLLTIVYGRPFHNCKYPRNPTKRSSLRTRASIGLAAYVSLTLPFPELSGLAHAREPFTEGEDLYSTNLDQLLLIMGFSNSALMESSELGLPFHLVFLADVTLN
jgi:hypothetical protein